MAAPIPTMTLTVGIPELAELVQTNRDLRDEIQNLRTELSGRLQAVETQLAIQNTNIAVPLQELVHETSPTHTSHSEHEDRLAHPNGAHPNGCNQQDGYVQDDGHVRDGYEDNLVQEHGLAHDSSPSVDEGITVIDRVSPPPASPPPAAGRKRKRAVRSVVHQSPYINHSGFVVRGSDTQLAQMRVEAGPLRSESPFDSNDDIQDPLSDKLEMMPPVRPLSKPPRAQRPKTIITDEPVLPEPVLPEPEEITTSQYGRKRRQAQRLPGFVSTPKDGKLNKMLREAKK
ncbi:hypothetical protein E4T50_15721 [Aureobasidium sp. EXF-12298]|nr:hypothetical protein E4T50_15721 [Aureobasidium sp. EXF-12298]